MIPGAFGRAAIGWALASLLLLTIGAGWPSHLAIVLSGVGLATWARSRGPASPPSASDERPSAEHGWLAGLLDGMAEGVVAFDRHGRVVFANPAACELLGKAALPDGTPMIAFSDIPRFRSTVVAALRGSPGLRELELVARTHRVLALRTTPTRDGAVAVILDLTPLRRMERSWRDLAGDASHELRTPVAAVLANLEAAAELRDVDRHASDELVEAATRQARRLGTLVCDLLDLARIESGAAGFVIEEVSVAEVVSWCLDQVRALQPEARPVVVLGEALFVRADRTALERILTNLLSNAARYGAGRIEVTAARRRDRVRIVVADEGPGVPEEHREALFRRFYRVDPSRTRATGGAGLGLAIVRELADSLGGASGYEPNEPIGARFWVELPTSDGAAPVDEEVERSLASP